MNTRKLKTIFSTLILTITITIYTADKTSIPSVMAAQRLVNSGQTNQAKLQIYQELISPEGYHGQVILEKYKNVIRTKLILWAQKQNWFLNTSTTQQPATTHHAPQVLTSEPASIPLSRAHTPAPQHDSDDDDDLKAAIEASL